MYLSLVISDALAARRRRAAPGRRVAVRVKAGKHHPVKSREARTIQREYIQKVRTV